MHVSRVNVKSGRFVVSTFCFRFSFYSLSNINFVTADHGHSSLGTPCGLILQISSTLATHDALESYTQLASHPLHSSSKPGILSIDVHPTKVIVSLSSTITALIYSTFWNVGLNKSP